MPGKRRVRLVTDSTADLPQEWADRLGVLVVPLRVHFGEESYRDGLDLPDEEFYRRLEAGDLPSTSQPPVGEFRRTYERAAGGGGEVVSVHLASGLSGTCQAALLAAEQVDAQVQVVDSGLLSMALGWVVVAAAEAARERRSLGEVAQVAQEVAWRTRILAYLEDLEHLRRGGRIGRAQDFLRALLDIRALVTLQEGETAPLERVRTRRAGLERLVERVADLGPLERVAVVHANAPEAARRVADGLAPIFDREQIVVLPAGQVVATHVGPGAVGVACVLAP